MQMMIGDTPVTVAWEDNASVEALKALAEEGLTIEMSMYGGFEQVGAIGQSLPRDDQQTTTSSGDIVLMHDGGGDRSQTIAALEEALPHLKEQGYQFITCEEMLEYPPLT